MKEVLSEKIKKQILEKRWLRVLLLIAGGAAGSLPLIFTELGMLSWIAMVPAFTVIVTLAREPEVSLRRMYGNTFIFFFTFYSAGFHWFIAMYPLDFVGGMSKLEALMVVIVATFGLGALQASFRDCSEFFSLWDRAVA